jgi:sulfur-carrier protein
MARLRLFGPAREAAGVSIDEVRSGRVGDILSEARSRYGAAFGDVLDRSQVWVNGEQVGRDAHLGPSDELAVVPPVSGG